MKLGLLILVMTIAAGCQSATPSAPGSAALVVHVRAEPKAGAQPPPEKVQVFDTPAPQAYGAFAKVDYSDLGQIVVWLEPADGQALPSAKGAFTIDVNPSIPATGLRQVVSVGQRIILRNVSSSAQTIYSVSDGNDFDFEAVPPGGRAEYVARSPGLIEILTNTPKEHPVEIYVAPSPWARLTRSGESLRFDNLPPGKYRLVSWHPRLPGSQETLSLSAGRVTDTSIDVTVNSLPKVTGAR